MSKNNYELLNLNEEKQTYPTNQETESPNRKSPFRRAVFTREEFFQSKTKNNQRKDILQPLIEIQNENEKKSFFSNFFNNSNPYAKSKRKITFNGNSFPNVKSPNVIRNQKYSALTLVPVVLFQQFCFFSNLFFLAISLSQLIPDLKVGFMFTYVAPLVIVLAITILKEAVDDFKRYSRDKETNNTEYEKVTPSGVITITSAEIKVGDILRVHSNQRIPSDMVFLKTNDKTGEIFIRTDQLDGETDWKHRKPIAYTQNLPDGDYNSLLDPSLSIQVDAPHKDIYSFLGTFTNENGSQEPLNLDNTLWANTVLASSTTYGIVIYTGKETRSQMNSTEPQAKVGKIDHEINIISKALFFFMLFLSVLIVILSGFNGSLKRNIISIFRFLLLLASIIPISLRVNLDFAKIIYAYQIGSDENIKGTIARNSTIPEELGRIQYLFSDKTGTLTQNEMIFKQICFESGVFTEDNIDELKEIINDECKKSNGPLKDIEDNLQNIVNTSSKKRLRRNRNNVIRDAITALCLCHNVTPIEDEGKRELQAASPDEVALVKLAESLGFFLKERNSLKMFIVNSAGENEHYDIIAVFPFSSDTKRMGILVRHIESRRLVFYLKGAEVIMEEKVGELSRVFLREYCENLASSGLRTLVISQKYVSEEFYQEWAIKYEQANLSMEDREKKVRKVVEELEENMEFLCVTGVEDKLQYEVSDTIESLRNAGIQIWMLTGDKVETAKCIAISTGLKAKTQKTFDILSVKNSHVLERELRKFQILVDTILVIDGTSLNEALKLENEEIFFNIAKTAPAVVCCRCSPTQKTLIVRGMKKYTDCRTAAIGDGGNDVGMIQEAHLGIGIVGKEGKQASMAADFSILEFRVIKLLILWHGRLSYTRSAVLSQFVIHRGLIISIIQVIFSLMFYYVSIPIYNGFLMLGYTTVFTSAPVFSLICDEDTTIEKVTKFPVMYKTLQKGRNLNIKTFIYWIIKSIYQGTIIMMATSTLFESNFLNIISITFTVLIFIEILNVYSEINKVHYAMLISFAFTIIMYLLTMYFLPNYINVSYIFNWSCISKILIVTFISWFPFFIGGRLFKRKGDVVN